MENADLTCKNLPNLLSSFADTFVDFSVSGIFLPPHPPPPSPPSSSIQFPKPADTLPSHPTPNTSFAAQIPHPLQTYYPSPERLIAIGDIHGDLLKFKQSLLLAGLIDPSDKWSGGSATVVQIGDVLDRGGEEIKILYFLEKLKRQAAISGGEIITMNGNHEIMNVDLDFRYVTKDAFDEFINWGFWYRIGNSMKKLCSGLLHLPKDPFEGIPHEFKGIKKELHDGFRARIAALQPNGPISTRFFSNNHTVLVIGDSVFVHGGLLPNHVSHGLENINEEVRGWINGSRQNLSGMIGKGRDSVVWSRKFSHQLAMNCDCETLEHVLATIPGARRMIMGHTIQEDGISAVCGNKAIRIDVGMSKGCGNGFPEVLEIEKNSGLRVLSSNPLYKEKPKKHEAYGASRKDGLGLLIPEQKQVKVQS